MRIGQLLTALAPAETFGGFAAGDVSDFRPEISDAGGYVTLCANCGWEDEPKNGE